MFWVPTCLIPFQHSLACFDLQTTINDTRKFVGFHFMRIFNYSTHCVGAQITELEYYTGNSITLSSFTLQALEEYLFQQMEALGLRRLPVPINVPVSVASLS